MDRTENIYTSPVHFAAELKTIFRRNWVCAGFASQIPSPGDMAPVTVGGLPLMLVRGTDHAVRIFHNVCRHRGSTLIDAACHGRKMIRCPYHSWVYSLSGELVQRPHFDGPDKHSAAETHLWPVCSGVWGDLIFVHIDAPEVAFDDFITPLKAIGDAYGISDARFDETIDITIDANWKLLVENFVDGYHVASVHPALERSVPTRTHRFRTEPPLFIGEAPRNTGQQGSYVAGLPEFPDLSDTIRGTLTYISVFPNLCLNMTSDRFSVYLMRPEAPDRSQEVICNYYASAAFDASTEDLRRSMARNQIAFNAEDIDALVQLQIGRGSDIYDAGQPSPYWDTNAEGFLAMCRAEVV